jgi:WD40 repeat protein
MPPKLSNTRDVTIIDDDITPESVEVTYASASQVKEVYKYARSKQKAWRNNIPLLYDYFVYHHTVDHSAAICWGKAHESDNGWKQSLFYTETQPPGSSKNNTIVMAKAEIFNKHTVDMHKMKEWKDIDQSPHISVQLKLNNPNGPVRSLRSAPVNNHDPTILASHTQDDCNTYIWRMSYQGDMTGKETYSTPDLTLRGHTKKAEYALAWANSTYRVASGGADAMVCVWDLNSNLSSIGVRGTIMDQSISLLNGHSAEIQDLKFKPGDDNFIMSGGDDGVICMWDLRQKQFTSKAKIVHTEINSLDFNKVNSNHVAVGSRFGQVVVVDIRMQDKKYGSFSQNDQDKQLVKVQWSPSGEYLAVAEDGNVVVWRMNQGKIPTSPMFWHLGHNYRLEKNEVEDFNWHPTDPHLLASIARHTYGGGSVQLWRINELLTLSDEELTNNEYLTRVTGSNNNNTNTANSNTNIM